MRVDLIKNYLDLFSQNLQSLFLSGKPYEEGFKWDIIGQWKDNFSLESINFSEAFAKSLKNDFSGRLWDGEKFSIKSGMIKLIEENPLLMQIAFQDLFDESKDISMRFNRFIFHCDEALEAIKEKDDRYNTHYQSEYSASLYLSLEYPEKYGLFRYEIFNKFMQKVDSRNIPLEQDKERYYKSLNALYTVISKDADFMNGWNFLKKDRAYTGKSLFLINDLMEYSVQQEKK